MDKNKTWFSTSEAAKLMGISRVTVFRWIKSGKIKADKVDKTYLIPDDELKEYIKSGRMPNKKSELIRQKVDFVMTHYGDTLKMLGTE